MAQKTQKQQESDNKHNERSSVGLHSKYEK